MAKPAVLSNHGELIRLLILVKVMCHKMCCMDGIGWMDLLSRLSSPFICPSLY